MTQNIDNKCIKFYEKNTKYDIYNKCINTHALIIAGIVSDTIIAYRYGSHYTFNNTFFNDNYLFTPISLKIIKNIANKWCEKMNEFLENESIIDDIEIRRIDN